METTDNDWHHMGIAPTDGRTERQELRDKLKELTTDEIHRNENTR